MTRTLLLALALALIVIGLALAVISGLAELIGLGDPTDPRDTFGWKQVVGLVVGVALVVGGIVMTWTEVRRRKGTPPG